MLCIGKKLVQRSAGARRDHVETLRRDFLHTAVADDRVQRQAVADFFQKTALLRSGFEEGDLDFAAQQFGQDESRKTGAAS